MFNTEGGIERMMRLYLKALCDLATAEDEVHLAVLNDGPHHALEFSLYHDRSLVSIIWGQRKRIRFVLRVVRAARHCDRVICGHVHHLPLADLAKRVHPKLKVYVVAHGIEVWRPWTLAERTAIGRGATVWAVSQHTATKIQDACPGIDKDAIQVIPNSLDPQRPSPPPAAPVPGLIITLTRLNGKDRYKGVDHLIEAMPTI
ncbi:MAG: glycosyltransferase [Candidatus Synoicihabitans palmerolidicus]|nr:glycosyltransferase [Candidatus Synoicihabitans palmerolidicus]